jgi:hypothetical protein
MRGLTPCVLLLLGLAGCATTAIPKHEAPPEVIEQPDKTITADEAVAEAHEVVAADKAEGAAADAQAASAAQAADIPAQSVAPAAGAPTAVAPTPAATAGPKAATTATAASRFRPSEESTEEILKRHQHSAKPLDFEEWMDHAHDRIYTWGQEAVEATDHKFADKDKELLPVPAMPFRLATMFEIVNHDDGLKVDVDIDLDISLRLPNIEKRLKIFVTSSELDESPSMAGNSPALRAGLRYEFTRDIDFDIGVRVDWPPVAFAALKWSREYQMSDEWSFYPLAKLFAESDDGVGYAAAATFDRWSGRQLLRSSTYTKRRWDRPKNEWSQTFVYARAHQLIVPDRYGSYIAANDIGIGWGVRVFGKDEGKFENKDATEYYEVGVFYRRPTNNKWLYLHFEPIVRWDKLYNYKADLGVRLGFDVLFWDLARTR